MSTKHLMLDNLDELARGHDDVIEAVEALEHSHLGATLTTDGRRLLAMIDGAVAFARQLEDYLRAVSKKQDNFGDDDFAVAVAEYASKYPAPASPRDALAVQQLRLDAQALVMRAENLLPWLELRGADPVERVCPEWSPIQAPVQAPFTVTASEPNKGGDFIINEWPLDGTLTYAGATVNLDGCENMDQLEERFEAAGLPMGMVAEGAKLLDRAWMALELRHAGVMEWGPLGNVELRIHAWLTHDGEHWVNQWRDDSGAGACKYDGNTTVATLDDVAECLADSLIGNGETIHLSDVNPAIRERMKGLAPDCFYFKGD